MNTDKNSESNYTSRFRELLEKFQSLEPEIKDDSTKQALSVMGGMIQELWRNINRKSGSSGGQDFAMQDVSEIYQNAPKMNGSAVNKPLSDGTAAPDFTLQDADGNNVRLSDFRGTPVLLVFYPLDWSPGCSQQLDLYQQEFSEFESRGVKVIGISVDSIYSHGAWAVVRKINFPLLADFNPKGAVASKYNVFREKDGFSERALYVIDAEGTIRYGFVSDYLHHIPDIYQLFKELDKVLKRVKA